jgi:hypothetical protein
VFHPEAGNFDWKSSHKVSKKSTLAQQNHGDIEDFLAGSDFQLKKLWPNLTHYHEYGQNQQYYCGYNFKF